MTIEEITAQTQVRALFKNQLEELAEKWLARARAIGHCHCPSATSRGRASGLREAARELKNTLSLILEQAHKDD